MVALKILGMHKFLGLVQKQLFYSYIGLESLTSRIILIIVLALYSSMHAARFVGIVTDGNASMYCSLAVRIMKGHYPIIDYF
jgi:hypothetical protein